MADESDCVCTPTGELSSGRTSISMLANVATRGLCALLAVAMATAPMGCATMFAGAAQTVRISTHPAGGSVFYQGVKLRDGDTLSVNKQFETPSFYLDADHPFTKVDMTYDPSAWLIADGALLFVFVLPGLVALGVDFGTGAWRQLHPVQLVIVPEHKERSGMSKEQAPATARQP